MKVLVAYREEQGDHGRCQRDIGEDDKGATRTGVDDRIADRERGRHGRGQQKAGDESGCNTGRGYGATGEVSARHRGTLQRERRGRG